MKDEYRAHVELEGFSEDNSQEILVVVSSEKDKKNPGLSLSLDVGLRWGEHSGVTIGDILSPKFQTREDLLMDIDEHMEEAKKIYDAISTGVRKFLEVAEEVKKIVRELDDEEFGK